MFYITIPEAGEASAVVILGQAISFLDPEYQLYCFVYILVLYGRYRLCNFRNLLALLNAMLWNMDLINFSTTLNLM